MPTLSHDLEETLERSIAAADDRNHKYVTLEHLLLALMDDRDATDMLIESGSNPEKLRDDVSLYLGQNLPSWMKAAGAEPGRAAGFQRVLQNVIFEAQSAKKEATGADMVRAILSERQSTACQLLLAQDKEADDMPSYARMAGLAATLSRGTRPTRRPEA